MLSAAPCCSTAVAAWQYNAELHFCPNYGTERGTDLQTAGDHDQSKTVSRVQPYAPGAF